LVLVDQGVDGSVYTTDTMQLDANLQANGEILNLMGAPSAYALMGASGTKPKKDDADDEQETRDDRQKKRKTSAAAPREQPAEPRSKVRKEMGVTKEDAAAWKKSVMQAVQQSSVMGLNLADVPFCAESLAQKLLL
jgi:hypothetical protein